MRQHTATELKTLQKELSCKIPLLQKSPDLKGAIREYFLQTYSLYEKLFEFLATD